MNTLEDLRIFLKKKFEDRAISQNALAPETFDRSTSPLHPEGLFFVLPYDFCVDTLCLKS